MARPRVSCPASLRALTAVEQRLKDAVGRARSPATLPGFRTGVAPKNKGLRLPAEVLTHEEIAALMDAIPDRTITGKRLRALVSLMYRAEAKIGSLLQLSYKHYDEMTGSLTLSGLQGGSNRTVRLDPTARRLLDDWLEARAALKVSAVSPIFCVVQGPSKGGKIGRPAVSTMLRDLGAAAGVRKRVTSEGLRKSRAQHRQQEVGRFEATILRYVGDDAFRGRHPAAAQKWSDAHALLETAPHRMATLIGHLCREAIIEFSDDLARAHHLGPFEANKTKAKIRAVFAANEAVSPTVRRSLEALLAYWETVSDLVQRQEHGSGLAEEDGRRLVFQTMLVMREIDLALRQPT